MTAPPSTSCRSTSGRTSARRRSRASRNEPARPPRRRVRPVRRDRDARASSSGSRRTPTTSSGAPKVDELVFRGSSQDSMAQALKQRRDRLRRRLDADMFNVPQGLSGHHDRRRRSTPASTRSRSTPVLPSTTGRRSATATRRSRTRRSASRSRTPSTRRRCVDRSCGGTASSAASIIPPIYANLHYDPGASAFTFDLAEGEQACSTRPATPRARTASARHGRQGRSTCGCSAARSRRPASRPWSSCRAGSRTSASTSTVKIVSDDTLTEIIGQGKYDMFEWGWVVEPDPDYQLSTFTCAKRSYKDGGPDLRQPVGLVLLQQGVRRAVRPAGEDDRPRRARRDRQAHAEDALRRRALHRHRLLRQPRGVPLRPVGQRPAAARPTAAYWSSSTAPTPTQRRAADRHPGRSSCRDSPRLQRQRCRQRRRRATPAATPGRIVGVDLDRSAWWRHRVVGGHSSWAAAGAPPLRTTKSSRGGRTVLTSSRRRVPSPARRRRRPRRSAGESLGLATRQADAHGLGTTGLRPRLQLLPVPAAARRPGRALHPRPQRRPGADP